MEEETERTVKNCFTCRNYAPGFTEVELGLCVDLDIYVRATDGEGCVYFRHALWDAFKKPC